MKLTKLSLIAALLMSSSAAFAVENVKVKGDAKLFYQSSDAGADMFDTSTSAAQAALGIGATADLNKKVKGKGHIVALSSLGLEGQLVGSVWEGTTDDSWIVDEAWLNAKLGKKTELKAGRQTLDTPLVFSEEWSIVHNTFEAAVLQDKTIPHTTIVGAYVGASNGVGLDQTANAGTGNGGRIQLQKASGTTFSRFYHGAYAAGIVTNFHKPLTLQAWYYYAPDFLDTYWVEADLDCKKLPGLIAGIEYTGVNYTASTASGFAKDGSNSALAAMIGYKYKKGDKEIAKIALAYSQVDKGTDTTNGAGANLAELGTGTAQSKLYTEAWWNYGYVTRADTTAYNLTAEYSLDKIVDLGLYVTQADTGSTNTMQEATLTATKEYGEEYEASIVYVYTKSDDQNNGDASNTLQVYLTFKY